MEGDAHEDSETSVNIHETPQTPTQTPLAEYNDIHTPVFHPFHPIPPMTPVLVIPHLNYMQLPIPLHPATTPESQPLNRPQPSSRGEAYSK